MVLNGFFNKPQPPQGLKTHEEYSVINVGTEQFHAAAAALIDSLHTIPRGNDAILKKILECFYQNFPKYANHQPYLTLSERMKILIDNHRNRPSELVECMAYVLRQLTVDELFRDPLKYIEVFLAFSPETLKSHLRDPQTQLPAKALDALAHALELNITLSYKEPGKECRRREEYIGETLSNHIRPNLTIQIQKDQYFPQVKDKKDFSHVGQLAISAPKALMTREDEGTLADIFVLIERHMKQLVNSYEQWQTRILSMYVAKEINLVQLRNLFINYYPKDQTNTLSLADLAHSKSKPVIADVPKDSGLYTAQLYADALASWIVNKKAPDNLLDAPDKTEQVEVQSAPVAFRPI